MLDWILENWSNIFAVIGIVGTACSGFVAIFSKCKWLSVVVNICDKVSIFNTAENKAKIELVNQTIRKTKKKESK